MEVLWPYLWSVVPFLCTSITIALFLSPWVTMRQMKAQGGTGGQSWVPNVAMAANCALWTAYGVFQSDIPLIFVNAFGLAASVYYLSVFWSLLQSTPDRREELSKHVTLAVVSVGGFLGALSLLNLENTGFYLGIAGSIFSVLMFGSPLLQMVTVIALKSTSCMSFPLSLMSALCTMSWVAYGFMIADPFVWLPNGIGFVLAALQLSLFVKYPSNSSQVQSSAKQQAMDSLL
eukprot:TRINITY_DN6724_c0_g1_i1.p1 TRINITY_DN6724_c0_g1~~TRINITY_DN6724_c0_g1_i1.p1  ORF type:complete len:232 (-),score=26.99 TRINITY_DN6724_c0_g1_i1:20-715(-)